MKNMSNPLVAALENDKAFHEVVREFMFWQQVYKDILDDISISKNKEVIYNIDFSYLFDYIWDKPAVDVPAFVPGGRQLFEKFIEYNDCYDHFSLVFTGPSYYELLDSIKHKINEVQGMMYSSDAINRISEEIGKKQFDDLGKIFVNSGISSTIMNYLPKVNDDSQIAGSFEKIRNVFGDNKTLKGIGDFIDARIFENHKDVFQKTYSQLLKAMLENPRKGETRSEKHRMFHYGVDSSNIITTINTNSFESSYRFLFVTQNFLRNKYCAEEGRSPYVPYFRVMAKVLEHSKIIGDSGDYFLDLHDRVSSILRDLNKYNSFRSLPRSTVRSVQDFFEKDMRDLGGTENSAKNSDDYTIESIRAIFDNKDQVESSFSEAKQQLESIGTYLVSRYRVIFEKDPYVGIMEKDGESIVMKEIRKEFIKEKNKKV